MNGNQVTEGERKPIPELTPGIAPARPINPFAAMTLVLVFPRRTFERLRERPHWVLAVLFVVAAVLAKSLLALESGVLDGVLESEAFLSGADIADVRAGAPAAFAASGVVGVPLIILLQALFYMVAGAVFGGRPRFVTSLSTIAHASVPIGVGALAAAALMPVTHSTDLGVDLSRFVDPTVHPFLWGLARELGVVPLWFYALLGVAAGPVFQLPRHKAWGAAGLFVAVHILIMSYLGVGEAMRQVEPHAGWDSLEVPGAILHFPHGVAGPIRGEAAAAASSASARLTSLLGVSAERIDCYVYPSLREKERVTGNAFVAHGVPWAAAVHVAWEGRPAAALAREMAQVASARALGKMYNPFIRNGLAVYVGADTSGQPVIDAAGELQAASSLPRLAELLDPPEHARLDARVGDSAAGSFTAFLIEELGVPAYVELYSRVARTGAPVPGALERALGDSLEGIEARWIDFILERAGAREADAH